MFFSVKFIDCKDQIPNADITAKDSNCWAHLYIVAEMTNPCIANFD